jgi:hypothetical protein
MIYFILSETDCGGLAVPVVYYLRTVKMLRMAPEGILI